LHAYTGYGADRFTLVFITSGGRRVEPGPQATIPLLWWWRETAVARTTSFLLAISVEAFLKSILAISEPAEIALAVRAERVPVLSGGGRAASEASWFGCSWDVCVC